MADTKISALTALDSTADLGQLYIPLFKADGSPDNARILAGTMFLCLNVVKNAADRLALRRSTNAQRFEVYRTYTDASTYERGVMSWYDSPPSGSDNGTAGTTFRIGTEKGSVGGTAQTVSIISGGVSRLSFDGSGDGTISGHLRPSAASTYSLGGAGLTFNLVATNQVIFGASDAVALVHSSDCLRLTNNSTGGAPLEFTEMSAPSTPAANKARIFARDNGSNKTQVCIILPDGVVTVLATET